MKDVKDLFKKWIDVPGSQNYEQINQHFKKNIDTVFKSTNSTGRRNIEHESAIRAYFSSAIDVMCSDENGKLKGETLKAIQDIISTKFVSNKITWDE